VAGIIEISRFAVHPMLTFAHEYGHFLDNRVLHPLRREYASRYDADFDDLMVTCLQSRQIRSLKRVLKWRGKKMSTWERRILADSLELHEIFARVYCQWVCSKSGNALLHGALQDRINRPPTFGGVQCEFEWDSDTFSDIIVCMDELLRKKGLQ